MEACQKSVQKQCPGYVYLANAILHVCVCVCIQARILASKSMKTLGASRITFSWTSQFPGHHFFLAVRKRSRVGWRPGKTGVQEMWRPHAGGILEDLLLIHDKRESRANKSASVGAVMLHSSGRRSNYWGCESKPSTATVTASSALLPIR